MTERNPYSPYNFDSYDNEKRKAAAANPNAKSGNVRKGILAGVGVLFAGAAFAGIVIASYPSHESASIAPPVIHADNGDIVVAPDSNATAAATPADGQQPGGALASAGPTSSDLKEAPPVENLLSKEPPMDKLEAFAHQTEANYADKGVAAPTAPNAAKSTIIANAAPAAVTPTSPSIPPKLSADAAMITAGGEETTPAPTLLKKAVASAQITQTKPAIAPAPAKIASAAPAGTSPQTMAFVKSELQKGATPAAAKMAAKIEPAAGAASPAVSAKAAASPGKYYLQLGSVTSEAGAATQWTKLQKQFPTSLKDIAYRVQKADVAGKGTFYRIQAGPLSKDEASNKCGVIKVYKPGGCIIVQ